MTFELVVASDTGKMKIVQHLDAMKDIVVKSVSIEPHSCDRVFKLESSTILSDIFLAITSLQGHNYKVIVCRSQSADNDRPASVIEGWTVRWSARYPIDAVFHPQDDKMIMYTSMTRDKIPCIEFRNYQNRQIQQRISLRHYVPKSLQLCVLDDAFFLLSQDAENGMSLYSFESDKMIPIDTQPLEKQSRIRISPSTGQIVAFSDNRIDFWMLNLGD